MQQLLIIISGCHHINNGFICCIVIRYGEKRDERELKDQWRRMKLQAKSEWSSFRSQTGKTGGGPPPAEPSMMAKEVKRLVPTEFSEMRNPFDDDCFITGNNPEAVTAELFIAGEKRPSLK